MHSLTAFPGFKQIALQRKLTNPFDKTTIVSIFPKDVIQEVLTVTPTRFEIAKAAPGTFTLLVLESASTWLPRYVGDERNFVEIPIPSYPLALSVIKDFCESLTEWKPNCKPGIFAIPGEFNTTTIHDFKDPTSGKTFAELLAEATEFQNNWYKALVRSADISWAQTGGNPISISDDAKMAAELLGLKSAKPWTKDQQHFEMKNCPACGNMVNPDYPICPNCKAVTNEKLAKERGLKFAV